MFTIQIITKYKLFLAEPWPRSLLFNVAPLSCEESHFSGPVLCSQHSPVIIPMVSLEVSSLELVERVRDAVSSTERHNIAAPITAIIGSLDVVLCPVYTCAHNPMQISNH